MSDTGEPSSTGRRALAYTVLLCLLGAALAVFAATRTWAVEVIARPAPLPAARTVHSGTDLLPWLPALALVGLAGAGAVLGTRGLGRRLVGGLLAAVGVGVAIGGAYGGFGTGHDDIRLAWPLLCVLGGLLTMVAGGITTARGATWPVMGARYERSPRRGGPEPDPAPDGGRLDGRRTRAAWDALDRGEDPTVS
ncbi:Trp biosynthesis-associated membrane protein [Plantactinospora sp. S1510]|uniref:Trp biosynthesis-associated membrane protein n=1 Tax=Plantactinospora alkalitolerans TaxID=2789879 RepID=A0ABS0GR61_9ACTN|nr:Trp biosynthesis-associated membrane protein [Plantactinospora alkalitolerans]MBF9128690.1 Trp biosynthesis-associated membrane protein [Plantactinospora alkalitolerans]